MSKSKSSTSIMEYDLKITNKYFNYDRKEYLKHSKSLPNLDDIDESFNQINYYNKKIFEKNHNILDKKEFFAHRLKANTNFRYEKLYSSIEKISQEITGEIQEDCE